jgi:hypothetical protein
VSDKTNPDYYKAGASDALAFVMAAQLDYPSGCIIKYLCRAGKKPGESRLDDLLKAKVYLDRMIEAEKEAEHIRLNVELATAICDIPELVSLQKRGRGKK